MGQIIFEIHRKENDLFIIKVVDKEDLLAFHDTKAIIIGDTYTLKLSSDVPGYLEFDDVTII